MTTASPSGGVQAADTSRLRFAAWYLIAVGISHFLAPKRWDRMTSLAYKNSVRSWTYRFGASETVMGLLMLRRGTRPLGIAHGVLQVLWIAWSFITLRRSGK